MSPRIAARVSHHFTASAEQVYDAWLDPERARVWMAATLKSMGLAGDLRRIEIDARPGGRFFFSDMRDGTEAKHWGTYLELDRPRRIVFTWIVDESEEANPSKVTLSFQPEHEGCTVTIVHEMDAKWEEFRTRAESAWALMLQHVEDLLAHEH